MQARAPDLLAMKLPHAHLGLDETGLPQPVKRRSAYEDRARTKG